MYISSDCKIWILFNIFSKNKKDMNFLWYFTINQTYQSELTIAPANCKRFELDTFFGMPIPRWHIFWLSIVSTYNILFVFQDCYDMVRMYFNIYHSTKTYLHTFYLGFILRDIMTKNPFCCLLSQKILRCDTKISVAMLLPVLARSIISDTNKIVTG